MFLFGTLVSFHCGGTVCVPVFAQFCWKCLITWITLIQFYTGVFHCMCFKWAFIICPIVAVNMITFELTNTLVDHSNVPCMVSFPDECFITKVVSWCALSSLFSHLCQRYNSSIHTEIRQCLRAFSQYEFLIPICTKLCPSLHQHQIKESEIRK